MLRHPPLGLRRPLPALPLLPALNPALFSRRRTSSRRQSRGGSSDWIWGLGLGLVALIVFGGGYLLLSGTLTGGSSSACDKPLAALDRSDTTDKGFAEQDVGMGKVVDALNRGDKTAAETAFYGAVRNFTHNADPPIRARNETLAKNLCQSVLDVEDDLAFNASLLKTAGDAQKVRDYLRDGAVALGYPRPQ